MSDKPQANISSRDASAGAGPRFNRAAHGLRGVAAIMVFVGHLAGGLALHVYPSEVDFVRVARYVTNLGTFGVEIFFLLSGYVIANSLIKHSFRDFFARRLVRIYPLFAFFTVLFFVMNLQLQYEPQQMSPWRLAENLSFMNIFLSGEGMSPNAWSISYEIWFYVLGATAVALARHGRVGLAAWAIAAAAFFVHYPISIYFIAGIAVYWLTRATSLERLRWLRWLQLPSLAVVAWLASAGEYHYTLHTLASLPVLALLTATTVMFLAFVTSSSRLTKLLETKSVQFMGTISYSFYLAHPYAYFVVRYMLVKLSFFDLPLVIVLPTTLLVMFASSVALSYVVHVAIERWPYERCFGRKVYAA